MKEAFTVRLDSCWLAPKLFLCNCGISLGLLYMLKPVFPELCCQKDLFDLVTQF